MNNFCNYALATVIALSAVAFAPKKARADEAPYLFGAYKNQFSIQGGVSLRSKLENFYVLELQYSQPSNFFRLAGRQNIELITAKGFGGLGQYDQRAVLGYSQDVVLGRLNKFYLGAGLGAYIKTATTERIGSKFTFGQKGLIGYRASDKTGIEIFIRHFSNGTLTELNSGQNFIGVSFHSNF